MLVMHLHRIRQIRHRLDSDQSICHRPLVDTHLHMVLQGMAFSLPLWVVEHPVTRLGLLEEDSGVELQPVEYLATCSAPLHLASATINRIWILLIIGAPQGSDHRQIGGHQDGVAAVVHLALEAAALAQELHLVLEAQSDDEQECNLLL